MKIKTLSAAILMTLPMASFAEIVPWKSDNLVHDFDSSTAGNEIAVPRAELIDKDNDGYFDRILVNYFVYTLGTKNFLYKTKGQIFTSPTKFPGEDCQVDDIDAELGNEWIGRKGSRVTYAFQIDIECQNPIGVGDVEDDNSKVYIYSANVDVNSKASWKYESPNDRSMRSIGGVDTDDNGSSDFLALTMEYDDEAASIAKLQIRAMNFSDGSKVAQQIYPFLINYD